LVDNVEVVDRRRAIGRPNRAADQEDDEHNSNNPALS
jgi:hypothetical protein